MKASIRALVASGEWGPGTKLPSTRELMATYDVSQSTVFLAMQELQAEGIVDSRWGESRFVPPAPEEPPSGEIHPADIPPVDTEQPGESKE
jgi:DNA-binding GntR family transcriptional regulator